jgi:hypothetical protein
MTGVTSEGYDDGIDYSRDYIGNLSDTNLKDCDCEDAEHTYHADDETAQWWIDHCREMEAHNDRVSQLTTEQRAEFDASADAEGTYSCDVEDQPSCGTELLDRLFGNEDEE